MKKLLCLFLSIITLFGVIGLTACGEPEKTDEQIAMEYFNEFKGTTYNSSERNENGWIVFFREDGVGFDLEDTLTIDNEGSCYIQAFTDNPKYFTGTFKIVFSKMQEEPFGSTTVKKYYFDLLENTTACGGFVAFIYNNSKQIYINIVLDV